MYQSSSNTGGVSELGVLSENVLNKWCNIPPELFGVPFILHANAPSQPPVRVIYQKLYRGLATHLRFHVELPREAEAGVILRCWAVAAGETAFDFDAVSELHLLPGTSRLQMELPEEELIDIGFEALVPEGKKTNSHCAIHFSKVHWSASSDRYWDVSNEQLAARLNGHELETSQADRYRLTLDGELTLKKERLRSLKVGLLGDGLRKATLGRAGDVWRVLDEVYTDGPFSFRVSVPIERFLPGEVIAVLLVETTSGSEFSVCLPELKIELQDSALVDKSAITDGRGSSDIAKYLEANSQSRDEISLAEFLAKEGVELNRLPQTISSVLMKRREKHFQELRADCLLQPAQMTPRTIPNYEGGAALASCSRVLKRICLVTIDFVGPMRNGGLGTWCTGLADLLARAGHEVTVLFVPFIQCEESSLELWEKYYFQRGIRFVPLKIHRDVRYTGKYQLEKSAAVYEWLKGRGFDWIHFMEMGGLGYYPVLAKETGSAFQDTMLCVGIHSPQRWHIFFNNQSLKDSLMLELESMERVSVARADIAFSPSQHLFQWVQERGWQLPEQCRVIPHPLPDQLLETERCAEAEELSEIVFFGRLETRKGLELFCDAIDLLDEQDGPAVCITFLGQPGEVAGKAAVPYIERRSRDWRFPVKKLYNFPYQRALKYLREGARLAVLPSIADSTAYTLWECMILQIPFLASNATGVPEAIHEEDRPAVLFNLAACDLAAKLSRALKGEFQSARPRYSAEQTDQFWQDFHIDDDIVKPLLCDKCKSTEQVAVSICVIHLDDPIGLHRLLHSIDAQEEGEIQIVVVDRGSVQKQSQQYLDRLRSGFARSNHKVLEVGSLSWSEACNLGASIAKGSHLCFVGPDQVFAPGALTRITREGAIGNFRVVFCGQQQFAGESTELRMTTRLPTIPTPTQSLLRHENEDLPFILRRESFLAFGGFSDLSTRRAAERELLTRFTLAAPSMGVIPEALVLKESGSNDEDHDFDLDRRSVASKRLQDVFPWQLREALNISINVWREYERRQDLRLGHGPVWYAKLFREAGYSFLALNERSGFAVLGEGEQVRVSAASPILSFSSTGHDPRFLLPEFRVPAGIHLVARVCLCVPHDTYVQLFYPTQSDRGYNEAQSVKWGVKAGWNEVYLSLPATATGGFYRLDPGAVPGDYEISSIEIRGVEKKR